MPTPNKGESRNDFASRCISVVMKQEKRFPNTPEGRKKAAGRCYGIYDNWKKKPSSSEDNLSDRELLEEFSLEWELLREDGETESDTSKLKELGKKGVRKDATAGTRLREAED